MNRLGNIVVVRARICRPFKEPRNRFPAWRACTTTLFVVPARQATWVGGIGLSESIPGLYKRLQIRAQGRYSARTQPFNSRLRRWYAQSKSIIIKTHSKTIVLQDYRFYLLVFFLSLLLFTVPRCKTIVLKDLRIFLLIFL
jgi:hypothetical protein